VGLGFENFGEGSLFSLHQSNEGLILEGMVLHLVPYLSEAGFAGGAFSETVVVTQSGCERVANAANRICISKA
jgi:Xaa-Pro dipeptidase